MPVCVDQGNSLGRALEDAGCEFIIEDECGGAGMRLRKQYVLAGDKPKGRSRFCRRIANHHNWNWDVFGHLAALRIRLAAWTMFMRASRTSSHFRVLRPQS